MANYKPLPDSLTIKESHIQGLGMFAIKDIANDVDLGLTHIEVDDEIIRTPLGGFINHSEKPNCVKIRGVLGREDVEDYNKYFLYTERPIKAWEELTVKYTFYKI